MTPAEVIAIIQAINAGVQLLEILIPKVQKALQNGEISIEDQKIIQEKFLELRKDLDSKMSQPHWQRI